MALTHLEGFVCIWVDLNPRGGSCKCCLPQLSLKKTFDPLNFLWLNTPMPRLEDQSAVVVFLWPEILHDEVTDFFFLPKSRSGHVIFKHVISFWKLSPSLPSSLRLYPRLNFTPPSPAPLLSHSEWHREWGMWVWSVHRSPSALLLTLWFALVCARLQCGTVL